MNKQRDDSGLMQNGYRLIDSGGFAKLEEIGGVRLSRPSSLAVWDPNRPAEWEMADMIFVRTSAAGGEWKPGPGHRGSRGEWPFDAGPFKMIMKLTDFGHIGLFPEQLDNWAWVRRTIFSAGTRIRGSGRQPRVMNLFGYTGGATLACLAAGAEVCHADASRAAVSWARENAEASGLSSAPARWIVDDARKFIRREAKRGTRYDGIILDPPTFGRGASGQVWKIEKDLGELLSDLSNIMSPEPLFFLLTCNTAGFTPLILEHLLAPVVPADRGMTESGEMAISYAPPRGDLRLPAGSFARWSAAPEVAAPEVAGAESAAVTGSGRDLK